MRSPSLAFVLPFGVFLLLLGITPGLGLSPRLEALLWIVVLSAVLALFSRKEISLRPVRPLGSVVVGVAVFLVWIAPDLMAPQWHQHWLFANAFTGKTGSGFPESARGDCLALALRAARAVILVPVIEELFWRNWLVRWIDAPEDFRRTPLGVMSRLAFWSSAILFASEHGALWDVGLVAGVAYNLWMQRTRSLSDLIVAHGVTNACLSVYVVIGKNWNYW